MKSDRVIIICLALLLLAVTCNTSKQSNLFIGTWKFISLPTESSVGDIYLPYDENPFGRLMYDHNGNRSAFLMRPNRPKFESGDIYNGTPEEIKSAFENFDAYYGKMTARVGIESNQNQLALGGAEDAMVQLQNLRDGFSGVSLDEEMINLIQFQRGFESSAKFLSTVDEMMNSLLGLKR